jgi:hypothetical protein
VLLKEKAAPSVLSVETAPVLLASMASVVRIAPLCLQRNNPEQSYVQAGGLSRQHWSNATPIRTIFREAFTGAALAYVNPHSFRKTLAQLGERLCQTPEEFKAWSQNLGHEQVLTTFASYGPVAADRQAELIRRLGQRTGTPRAEIIDRMIQVLQDGKLTFE